MRLVDADALIETMEERKKIWLSKTEYNDAIREVKESPTVERPHGECNQCRYYDGVPGVPGHAPCWHWNIGGVMWNDYCSRFEKAGDEK